MSLKIWAGTPHRLLRKPTGNRSGTGGGTSRAEGPTRPKEGHGGPRPPGRRPPPPNGCATTPLSNRWGGTVSRPGVQALVGNIPLRVGSIPLRVSTPVRGDPTGVGAPTCVSGTPPRAVQPKRGRTGPDLPPPPRRGKGGGHPQGPRARAPASSSNPKAPGSAPLPVLRYGGALMARCAPGPSMNRGHTENPPKTTAVSLRVVPKAPSLVLPLLRMGARERAL